MSNWTEEDASDQTGRIFIITGANSGIGFEATRLLVAKGATVVMACRNPERAAEAHRRLLSAVPDARAEVMALDLADLESVRAFATAFLKTYPRLDVLINNAGLMALPRQTTAQGFETQLGVNHLGHFALTIRLLPRLVESTGSRVVNVSSEAHRAGSMNFDDLMGEQSYRRWGAYTQSKLANLLFTRALQARLSATQAGVAAYACHPGYANTELQGRSDNTLENFFFKRITNRLVAQSAYMGALPTVRAAVDPSLTPGDYVGPQGMFGARGYPVVMKPSRAATSDAHAEMLWQQSETLTGLRWPERSA